ncbi:MAG: 3D domain-containing protein, partial [Patescibacteria group bacterium]|nr:3D domain-containing protein [Patescibacteria group bacterium]
HRQDALLNRNPISLAIKETRTITAYSCTTVQCGPVPLVTASGQHVRNGIVASNWLPFGTKIMIPELFGDKVFVVEDRTAPQYGDRVDVWFPSTKEAVQFGIHRTTVEILTS